MNINSSMRRLVRPARLALVAGVATLLVGAVLEVPAGAVATPYSTTTTVKTSAAAPVTGQSVTWTATVKATGRNLPTPLGTVTFAAVGSDSSTPVCDGGDTVNLSGGTAQCTFSGGLQASASPIAVTATYVDNVDSNDNGSFGTLSQTVNPGKTLTTLASSSNPSTTAQPVTFTAGVTEVSPASGTLTGSVTFAGVTCDGGNTVPLASGMATCSIASGLESSGSPFTVTATYGSDPEFAGSSAKVKQVVSASAATVTLASDPNTCNGDICTTSQGTPLTFTATATGAQGTPTGNIVFSIIPAGKKANQSLQCDGGNTVALNAGQASCSFANGLPAIVYYTVTATLVDPNYQTASATLYENTALLSTNTAVTVEKGVTAGETFTVTATVTPLSSSSNPPTGGVDITVCGENSNGGNGCQGAIEPVAPDGTAVLSVGGGEFPGNYAAYATYIGDGNYLGSSAKKHTFGVTQAPTTIAIQSSANPSVDGSAVTLTATITAANGGADSTLVGPPTGNLVFTITGPSGSVTCQGGNSIPLDNGQADEDVAQCYLPPGTMTDPASPTGNTSYSVRVDYSSDGDFLSSHTSTTQVVVPAID